MRGESLLQNLQRFATIAHRLDALTEEVRDLRSAAFARIERLEGHVADVRERLARLETSYEADLPRRVAYLEAHREVDRAQIEADLARFKAEVERAEYRITRLLSGPPEPPALPGEGDEEA